MRIGLLGGSFNPAHGGHRAISLKAMDALGLDAVWWLVSPGNPLKPVRGMAPLPARFAAAANVAAGARIRVTAIEQLLRTRYTVDTLRALVRHYPRHQFIWLMGADNLAQFPQWRQWRRIARTLPIAVVARPGYDREARAGAAMSWLRRFVRPAATAPGWPTWRLPAVVLLRFRPDERSATLVRARLPDWQARVDTRALRDHLTFRSIR